MIKQHYIHLKVCKYYGIMDWEKCYKHQPITEEKGATIIWDFAIQTDRKIKSNRQDIVVKGYNRKTCLLIDMSVPTVNTILIKEYHKLSKYKDLEIEVEKMCHLKTTTMPVIVGA